MDGLGPSACPLPGSLPAGRPAAPLPPRPEPRPEPTPGSPADGAAGTLPAPPADGTTGPPARPTCRWGDLSLCPAHLRTESWTPPHRPQSRQGRQAPRAARGELGAPPRQDRGLSTPREHADWTRRPRPPPGAYLRRDVTTGAHVAAHAHPGAGPSGGRALPKR